MNTYLLDIIQQLEKKERTAIVHFLESKFFSPNANVKDLIKLTEVLWKLVHHNGSVHHIDREQIYKAVFGSSTEVPGKLDKLMSELKKQLRLYILAKSYFSDENEVQLDLHWSAWLRQNHLKERFDSNIASLKKKSKAESIETYHNLLNIAIEEHEWAIAHNYFYGDLGINELLGYLDLYYTTYRTDLINLILLQKKATKIARSQEIFTPQTFKVQSHLLEVLKSIQELLEKDDLTTVDFQSFASVLKSNQGKLHADVLKVYAVFLRNLCTLLIDAGHLEYVPILHQLHRNSLADNDLLINGTIEPNTFLNIVQIAIRAKEIEWAKSFAQEFKSRILGGDETSFIFNYSLASCLFAEGKFEAARECMPEESASTYYQLMTRRLEVKIYYELQSDLFEYKLDAFRKFIERTAPKSIAEDLRMMNLNFIYIMNQLEQSQPKDKNRAEKILKRIEEKKLICDRSWLIEKASELK